MVTFIHNKNEKNTLSGQQKKITKAISQPAFANSS
jgi:hypothetical protein